MLLLNTFVLSQTIDFTSPEAFFSSFDSVPNTMDIPPTCPQDQRRTPQELYIKLAVMTLTGLLAYDHLLSVRKERFVVFRVLIMLLCPLVVAWDFLFPTLILLARALVHYTTTPSAVAKEACWRDFSLLFGRLAEGKSQTNHGEDVIWPPTPTWTLFRRLALQFLLLAQCVASTYFFRRRVIRSADDPYDHRILQLAICVGCTGMQGAIHIIFSPTMPPPRNAGESWIHFYRKFDYRSVPGGPELPIPGWNYLPSIIISDCLIAFLMAGIAKVCELKSGLSYDSDGFQVLGFFILTPCLSMVLLGASATVVMDPMEWDLRSGILHITLWGLLASMFITYFTRFDYKAYDYWGLLINPGNTLQNVGSQPTELPYPLAWKDPAADYLWWLA